MNQVDKTGIITRDIAHIKFAVTFTTSEFGSHHSFSIMVIKVVLYCIKEILNFCECLLTHIDSLSLVYIVP